MTGRAALGASLLAVLATPATWALALLTFLLRGGILLVLLPIVAVPSAVGLGAVIGPALTHLVLGDARTSLLVLGGGGLLLLGVWLGLGGWLAAAAEAESIRLVAADDEVGAPVAAAGSRRVTARILVARLVAWLPLLVTLVVGSARLVLVSYRELTVPTGDGTPLVVRVAAGSVDALFLIVVAWLLGEIVGGLAARRIVLRGARIPSALREAIVDLVRHPLTVLGAALLPLLVLVAVLVPSAVATGAAWSALRTILTEDAVLAQLGLVVLLVVLWLGGLVLCGLVGAWRGAVWTVLVARTFGGVPATRPGEWSAAPERGTLTGLRSDGADQDSR